MALGSRKYFVVLLTQPTFAILFSPVVLEVFE